MKKIGFILCFPLFVFCACSPSGDLAGVMELSDGIGKQFIPDKRVGVYDVAFRMEGKLLVVKGMTTSGEAKSALMAGLLDKKYQTVDSLLLLPDEKALDGKTYAVINLSVANMRSSNDFSSEMLTQALLGMPVRVIQHEGWYRIQTPDNYLGWVHRAAVKTMTKEEYNTWNRSEKVIVTQHYGFTYQKPDSKSQSVSDVVAGDRLKLEGAEKDFYRVSYPDGKTAYIEKRIAKPEREWRGVVKQDAASILATARTLLGVPYLWAGTSSKGIDCSGFVRTVLFMHDIIIPRDASQQAYVGKHIDIDPGFANLMPGDLLFFGRKATPERKERVVHVGIYIGDKNFIHSQGDVRINSFDPARADYDEYNLGRLLFATRILDSINKIPEINTTSDNPYYLPQ